MNNLTKDDLNLIWIDLEMTGLDCETDRILEVAIVVTDAQLNKRVEAPVFAIRQSEDCLQGMDSWNQKTHGRSGLLGRVRGVDSVSEQYAEQALLQFLQPLVNKGQSPMCGNSICQDRRFLAKHMPELERYFHYRHLDVSTLKELARRWHPQLLNGFHKREQHTALADIVESIEELAYYREHFIKI